MNILFLLLAIALFIALVLKNVPIVIATILSSIFLLLTQQMDLYDGITATYMTGFGDYVRDFFLLFMLGALFGKLVEISGAANSISTFIFRAFGDRFAIIGLIIMGIILTLGGVNLFVAMFTMYPLAMAMFRRADIPRKFFAAAYFVGCVGATMTAPFTPSIQNATPTVYLGTTVAAAAVPGMISTVLKLVFCTAYVMWVVKRAKNRGEHFEELEGEAPATEVGKESSGPSVLASGAAHAGDPAGAECGQAAHCHLLAGWYCGSICVLLQAYAPQPEGDQRRGAGQCVLWAEDDFHYCRRSGLRCCGRRDTGFPGNYRLCPQSGRAIPC